MGWLIDRLFGRLVWFGEVFFGNEILNHLENLFQDLLGFINIFDHTEHTVKIEFRERGAG